MKLTDHFTLEEMTFSQTAARLGISNAPCGITVNNLTRLCRLLEEVRLVVARPIAISSGYSSQALNNSIEGSAKNSQHTYGCAADFTVKGLTVDEVISAILLSNIEYDQLIHEYSRWVHISVPNIEGKQPRNQVLIKDAKGTRPYT
jgi:zinc D-Ala-D-Ala carboxypeptidase